ncbi:MAG: hypothetical protein HOP29_19680, partial [Phycisphaerales bacterium]|nr:hypothetical protein [Phycisphaerales bacterium]
MKTERRAELRSNDLSAFLLDTYDWTRDHATHLGGAAVLVAVILFATAYVRRTRTGAVDAATQTLSGLKFTAEDVDTSFKSLETLIHDATDRDFKMTALLHKGDRSLALATDPAGSVNAAYLDQAESAYEQLRTQYPERMPIVGTSLHALATVEENRFVLDSDMRHRDKARAYLDQVVNAPAFRGTPFQTRAAERIQNLDIVFRTVTIAEALPLPAPTITVPTEDGTINLGVASPDAPQVIRLDP